MADNLTTSGGSPGSPSVGRWVGLVVGAVILAEGIWGILVSLTRSVLLPLMARGMGGDPQSPLYLGKGDFNIPDIFSAVVQLCLAGILFLLIRMWAAKGTPRPRVAVAKPVAPTTPVLAQPVPQMAAAQAAASPSIPVPTTSAPPPSPKPAPAPSVAKPAPAVATVAAKPPEPPKPKQPKEVYYNIVGEPITPDDE